MNKENMMQHKVNSYNIVSGYINSANRNLDNRANIYNENVEIAEMVLYKKLTSDLFVLLEENNKITMGSELFLHEACSNLRKNIGKEYAEYVNIASALGKIVTVKIGDMYIPEIEKKGTEYDLFIDSYTKNMKSYSDTLSNSKFCKIDEYVDEYIKTIIKWFHLDEEAYVKNVVKRKVKIATNDFLNVLISENTITYENFSKILETANTYLKNYSDAVSNTKKNNKKAFKTEETDELGVSIPRFKDPLDDVKKYDEGKEETKEGKRK